MKLTIVGYKIADSDVSARPRKCERDGLSDSAPGPGNDGYFTA